MRLKAWQAAVALAIVACNDATSGGANVGGRSTTITVGNNFYNPTPDTVPAGSVTFSWSTPSNGHDVTWDGGPGTLPATIPVRTSGTADVTLVPGTYVYHCSIHGSGVMSGTIVVQ